MYQNIIFDLGGVVVDFKPREFLVDYFMNEKLEDQLFDITFGSEEWKQLDAGLISRHQAEAAMRKRGAELGHSFEVDAILNDWMDMLRTKDDTERRHEENPDHRKLPSRRIPFLPRGV